MVYLLLGHLAGWVMRLLRLTLRFEVRGLEYWREASLGDTRPVLFALFHEQQLQGILFSPVKRLSTMASQSKDGDIIATALRWFGLRPARGSSSRGGRAALAELERLVAEEGYSCCLTIDGPRGPRRQAKMGLFRLALRLGFPIIPAAAVVRRAWCMRSWDRFQIAQPFTRGELRFGPALWVKESDDFQVLARQLEACMNDLTDRPFQK